MKIEFVKEPGTRLGKKTAFACKWSCPGCGIETVERFAAESDKDSIEQSINHGPFCFRCRGTQAHQSYRQA